MKSESQVNEILSQYKLIGRGYRKNDPELDEALKHLKAVNRFLNSRCAWSLEHDKLIKKVQSVTHDLEIYKKMDSEYYSNGLFEKGFEYSFQELRHLKEVGKI